MYDECVCMPSHIRLCLVALIVEGILLLIIFLEWFELSQAYLKD